MNFSREGGGKGGRLKVYGKLSKFFLGGENDEKEIIVIRFGVCVDHEYRDRQFG